MKRSEIIKNAPSILEYINLNSKSGFDEICKGLDHLNINVIDKNLVRGLDYYCHTAFEFITNELGSRNCIGWRKI